MVSRQGRTRGHWADGRRRVGVVSHDLDTAVCCRCGRTVSVLDAEFVGWEAVYDENPNADLMVCGGCLTPDEDLHDTIGEMEQQFRDAP